MCWAGTWAARDAGEMLRRRRPRAKGFGTVTAPSPRAIPAAELAARIEALGGRAEPAGGIPAAVARVWELAAGGPAAALGTLYFSGEVREAVADLAKHRTNIGTNNA